jgi:hypothetical protein
MFLIIYVALALVEHPLNFIDCFTVDSNRRLIIVDHLGRMTSHALK